ncbi:conserved hypothetical protein [Ricinus communis]|uniref:Uncharacterized protein n=1 Tax=Ricinus communis TaxID=3988 RepID=B9T9B8_RICCO|nr:conserved hypothetical protein [Ricinus communis]
MPSFLRSSATKATPGCVTSACAGLRKRTAHRAGLAPPTLPRRALRRAPHERILLRLEREASLRGDWLRGTPPDHHLEDVGVAHVVQRNRGDAFAAAQNGGAQREFADLREAVRDVKHCRAARGRSPDESKQPVDVDERASRLVENQQLRSAMHRTNDLDALTPGERQTVDRRTDSDIRHAIFVQHGGRRFLHPVAGNQTAILQRLRQEEVLRDREIRHQTQFLKRGGHTRVTRFKQTLRTVGRAVQQHAARIGPDDARTTLSPASTFPRQRHAEIGAADQQPQHRKNRDDQRRDRNAGETAGHRVAHEVRHAPPGHGQNQQREALENDHRAERRSNALQPAISDQITVQQADREAHADAHREVQSAAHRPVERHGRDQYVGNRYRADQREIEAARQHDHRLPGRREHQRCRVAGERRERVGAQCAVVEERVEREHQHVDDRRERRATREDVSHRRRPTVRRRAGFSRFH